MTAGILTTNNDPTRRLSSKHVDLLRNQCDDVRTYMECGWFCVVGYKGDKRLVHAPCNNREEYETSMGLLRQSNPWNGYGEDGETGYLTKATATYSVDGEQASEEAMFFSSENLYSARAEMVEQAEGAFRPASDGEIRTITFRRQYWDQLPRFEQVNSVGEKAERWARY